MNGRSAGLLTKVVLLGTAAALAAAGCTSAASPAGAGSSPATTALKTYTSESALVTAAKKEGTLSLIIAPEYVPFLVNGFKKAYPWAKVNFTALEPDQAAAKLLTEVNSGVNDTDVVGVWPTALGTFEAKGQLARIKVPNDANILPGLADTADSYYHPMLSVPVALLYNTDIVKSPPRTLEALADPKWSKQLTVQSPFGSGVGEQVFAMGHDTWGDAKWRTWLQGVGKNQPSLQDSDSSAFAAVQRGDRGLCICSYQDFTSAPKGSHLGVVFFDQKSFGDLDTTVDAAVLAKAPHPAMAALWLNYMLSASGGQKGMAQTGRNPSVTGVPGGIALQAGTKVAQFSQVLADLIKRPDYYQTAYKKYLGG